MINSILSLASFGPSRRSRRGMSSALAIAGVTVLLAGCGQADSRAAIDPVDPPTEAARPPQPKHLDVATPAQEAAAKLAHGQSRVVNKPRPKGNPKALRTSDGSIPPASAGTNGSYTPPPASQQKSITAQTTAGYEGHGAGQAILLGRTALAPPDAPDAVKAAISAANQIVGRPYVWGGGHASWYSAGYDCSGAVSYALGGGGLLSAPLDSTALESWGAPGPGRWITVYANAGHAYAVIAGLRWDTVGDAKGTGPRWHAELPYPKGFVVRHPPGY